MRWGLESGNRAGQGPGDNFLLIRGASPSPERRVDIRIKVLSQVFKIDKTS